MKCLICNKDYARVCRHVYLIHKMTAREYKKSFGLDVLQKVYLKKLIEK